MKRIVCEKSAKSGSYTGLNQVFLAELTISTMRDHSDVRNKLLWDEVSADVIAERANRCSYGPGRLPARVAGRS